jgi:hypothetical protein
MSSSSFNKGTSFVAAMVSVAGSTIVVVTKNKRESLCVFLCREGDACGEIV